MFPKFITKLSIPFYILPFIAMHAYAGNPDYADYLGQWSATSPRIEITGIWTFEFEEGEDNNLYVTMAGPMNVEIASFVGVGADRKAVIGLGGLANEVDGYPLVGPMYQVNLVDGVASFDAPVLPPEADGLKTGVTHVTVKRRKDRKSLSVQLVDEAGLSTQLEFFPADDARFDVFKTARLDDQGNPVKSYSYEAPRSSEHGMPVSNLRREKLSEAQFEKTIDEFMNERYYKHPAFLLVAKNGKLVVEEYFYGATRDRLWTMQSISKSLTSLLAGIASESGKLDLDQPINPYFEDYKTSAWMQSSGDTGVTPRHLLRMGDVVGWGDSDGGYTGLESPIQKATFDPRGWLDAMFEYRVITEDPDPYHRYNSIITNVLGATVERATGEHLSDFLQESVLSPLGEERSMFPSLAQMYGKRADRDYHAEAAGYALLRPMAMVKIGQLVLNRGKWKGKQIVSENYIVESTSLQAFPDNMFNLEEGIWGYGYQWWLRKFTPINGGAPVWVITGEGYGGQAIGIVPEFNAVFAYGATDFNYEGSPADFIPNRLLPAITSSDSNYKRVPIRPSDLGFAPLAQ